MIYRDHNGYLCTDSGDQGDGSLRVGILGLFSKMEIPILDYVKDGWIVRSPIQEPWRNKLNMSRDNTIPFVGGLWARGFHKEAAQVFWRTVSRGCFAANSERDFPGTTKYPWPHKMEGGDPVDNGKWRMFDYADPILPHQLFYMALCGKVWQMYWLAIIAYPLMFLSILFNSRKINSEQNQIICMAKVYGLPWPWLYKYFNPNWVDQTKYYWESRGEKEFSDFIIQGMK